MVSLEDHIGRSLVQQKLIARHASFFGLLGLLLACVGLYGVMSYGVARRTNEIGIRMALGAQGRSVLWLVLRAALLLVVIGLVVGVLASLALTKTAASLLYELKPNDPLIRAFRAALRISPDPEGIRFSHSVVGRTYVEDAYLYRLPVR